VDSGAFLHVPLLDLRAQYASLAERLAPAIERVIAAQRFLLGPEVEAFEAAAAEFLGTRHAIGVSSGSDALVCALLALGVGPGDEVITPPFSFFASVESIVRVGARPVFVDIDPETFSLDVDGVRAALGPRTRAVLVVHLYGQPARVDELVALAAPHGVPVVEDAAQAFGARLHGRNVGTFGALGCFSFQPTKPLGAFGDAGMVVTDDAELAERCRRARVHGAIGKHQHASVGGNYRMDALQGAVLREKLAHLPEWLARRRAHARAYSEALTGLEDLVVPAVAPGAEPSGALYTIRVRNGRRDALGRALAERGVETAVHYPLALHRQPALLALGLGAPEGACPVAEQASREVLSLPVHPELSEAAHAHVVRSLFACLR